MLFKSVSTTAHEAFEYLQDGALYFDSACQTLRPRSVIDAQNAYYEQYNACGGRVKYAWGERVDREVEETREKILKLLKVSPKEYAVAFTLNTTYGVNLVLHQLPHQRYKKIITSEIEHNSVFVPTITIAKKHRLKREVLPRDETGALVFEPSHIADSIIVLNTTSNIDARRLGNVAAVVEAAHAHGSVVLLDAAQSMAHDLSLVQNIEFDALFFSAHKMYAPSMGVIVIRKELLAQMEYSFLGGGTVTDVQEEHFAIIDDPKELHARLECGLQNFAAIVGLRAAIDWLNKRSSTEMANHQEKLSEIFYQELSEIPGLTMLNRGPSPITCFYSDKIDAHTLAYYLSAQNIMARSGYFCCHYYLHNLKKYPPLLRLSLGLNNTEEQVRHAADTIRKIITNN